MVWIFDLDEHETSLLESIEFGVAKCTHINQSKSRKIISKHKQIHALTDEQTVFFF